MAARVLVLNSDPVFADRILAIFDAMREVELRVARALPEAIHVLMREDFDHFFLEGETELVLDEAINARQHFPSLKIIGLLEDDGPLALREQAQRQDIRLVAVGQKDRQLRLELQTIISAAAVKTNAASEGIDPCHSLIGNLNQFSAAEILQMSCLSQRSGRFTFKSGRGAIEVYLHHGMVRHALYDSLEGEAAISEVFRWRQGRFYFEEGIISQVQTVNRPWAHLMLDNFQKLDETMQMVSVAGAR